MDAPRHSIRSLAIALCLLAVSTFLLSGVAVAAWVSLGGSEGAPAGVRVVESSAERTLIEYTIPGFYAEPVEIEGRTYYSIRLAGDGQLMESGLPALPRVTRSVIVPDDAKMAARVIEADVEDLRGYPVAPSKGNLLRTVDPSTIPYSFGPAYREASWWPESIERCGEPYVLRDFRGLAIEVVPIQAQGSTGALRAARRLLVEVAAVGTDTANTLTRSSPPERLVPEFADLYARHFLNWSPGRYTPLIERGRMLVITYDAFHAAMLPFVEWKNQMGMPTRMVDVSTIGNTSAQIDAYIDSAYNTEGLAFVLLVGDGAQVATAHAAGGASDPTYAKIVGTDNYPEIFVGRFSAENTAQVQTQVARTIAYEKTPMAGANWYRMGTGIGSDQGPGDDNEYDYQHQNVIRTKLLGFGYSAVDQIYDPGATAAMVTSALNAGRGIINYTGHGSETTWGTTGFSNTNVAALTNDGLLPFIYSVACVNGAFESTTCFAEAWMRATRNGNPTGAIATYMSSINQSWNPPMCAQDASVDLLVQGAEADFRRALLQRIVPDDGRVRRRRAEHVPHMAHLRRPVAPRSNRAACNHDRCARGLIPRRDRRLFGLRHGSAGSALRPLWRRDTLRFGLCGCRRCGGDPHDLSSRHTHDARAHRDRIQPDARDRRGGSPADGGSVPRLRRDERSGPAPGRRQRDL